MGPWEESMRVQLLREVIHPRFADKGLPQHLHPLNQADNSLIWRQKPHNHRTCSSQCNSTQETCTKLTLKPIFFVNTLRIPQVQYFSTITLNAHTHTHTQIVLIYENYIDFISYFLRVRKQWFRNWLPFLWKSAPDNDRPPYLKYVRAGVQHTAAVKRSDLTATSSDPSARLDTCIDVSVVSPTTRLPNSFTSYDSGQTTLKHKPTTGPGPEMEINRVQWISRPSNNWNNQGLSRPVQGLLQWT